MITGVAFLIAVGLLGVGMSQNIKYGDKLCKYYPFFFTLISGFGAAIALIGLVMTVAGGSHAGMILGGLVVTVVVQLPTLKQAADRVAEAKELGMPESEYKKLGPVPVFIRLTLVGLGKVGHILLTCTIIGIPLYRSMVNMQNFVDAYCAQIDLREELEALKEAEKQAQLSRSVKPSHKAQPSQAAQPSQKAQPSQAAQPSQKAQPSQAAQPSQKAQPSQAAQPSQKAQPSQAAQPSQKAQPSQAARQAQSPASLDAQGYYDLAIKHLTEDEKKLDLGEVCGYLAKAADGGVGNANFYLGHIMFTQATAIDTEAPDFGNQMAQTVIGGAKFFAKAVETADASIVENTIQTIAGTTETLYNTGMFQNVFRNAMESQYAELLSELQGRDDGPANYALGLMHMYGVAVEQDYSSAKQFFEKSAAQGMSASAEKLENPIFADDDEDE